jgi:hypothetical protein
MLLVLLPAGAAAQPVPEAARISSEQYIQELDSWIAYFRSIEKGEGTPRPADPPQEWIVTTTSGEFRVDPGFVRDALAGGAELNAGTEGSKPDRERVAGIAAGWLEQMREGAEAHGQPAGSDLREQARAVLSRGEFRRVRAPGFQGIGGGQDQRRPVQVAGEDLRRARESRQYHDLRGLGTGGAGSDRARHLAGEDDAHVR